MKERGGNAKLGDVIPYIFCLGADGTAAKTGQADRAYHPEELKKADGELKIGEQDSLSSLTNLTTLCFFF